MQPCGSVRHEGTVGSRGFGVKQSHFPYATRWDAGSRNQPFGQGRDDGGDKGDAVLSFFLIHRNIYNKRQKACHLRHPVTVPPRSNHHGVGGVG